MQARGVFGVAMFLALSPMAAHAQAVTSFHNFEVRGPNSLGLGVGTRVNLGAFAGTGVAGTATRDPTENCDGPASVPLANQGMINVPTLAFGGYSVSGFPRVCKGGWSLDLNVGGVPITSAPLPQTPTLSTARLIPFVSNNTLTSSADGKMNTFKWVGVPDGMPPVDSVRVNIWDRTLIASGGLQQLVTSSTFPDTQTGFVIDLNQVASPYAVGRPYTMEVSLIDTRDHLPAAAGNILSRSSTYFDFTLSSAPKETGPVFLPIVEYEAGNPKYTFTITVDGTGTFVIDPDIAVGYVYQTAPGNPNFRSVTLPAVGDGRYLVEVFDADTGQYGRSFIARAGQTYSAPAHGYPNGVSKFRVKGIEASAALDAANATAFPTALQFMGPGTFTGSMTPITKYTFSGFLPPINLPPTVNTGRAGSSFPFKWTLADLQGAAVTDLGSVSSITYKPSACAPFTADPTGGLPAKAADDSRLRFDNRPKQYVFGRKTPKEPGCYALFLTLDTGQVFSANVMLSKARERGD